MPSRLTVERYHVGPGATVAHPRCTTNRYRLNLHAGNSEGPVLLQIGAGRMDAPCLAEVARRRAALKEPFWLTLRASLAGTTMMRVKNLRLRLAPGSYLLENPKDFAQFELGEAFTGVTLAFSQTLLRAYREDVGIPKTAGPFDFRVAVEPLTPALASIVTRLGAYAKPGGSGDDEDLWIPPVLIGGGARLLSWLWTHHPNELRERLGRQGHEYARDPRLLRAKEYLRVHLADPANLQDAAALAGLSPSTFYRLCRREFHCAPKWLLRRLRLEEAERLAVRSTDPDWMEIAQLVGFSSDSTLSRAFRRTFGRTLR